MHLGPHFISAFAYMRVSVTQVLETTPLQTTDVHHNNAATLYPGTRSFYSWNPAVDTCAFAIERPRGRKTRNVQSDTVTCRLKTLSDYACPTRITRSQAGPFYCTL